MGKFKIGIDAIVTHKMVSPGRKDDPSDETYDLVIARIKTIAG